MGVSGLEVALAWEVPSSPMPDICSFRTLCSVATVLWAETVEQELAPARVVAVAAQAETEAALAAAVVAVAGLAAMEVKVPIGAGVLAAVSWLAGVMRLQPVVVAVAG